MPNAVPEGDGKANLQPLGPAGHATQLSLMPVGNASAKGASPTSVTLFDQGLVQVLQAAVSGVTPKMPYVLCLATTPDGTGTLQPLQAFKSNPAGAAVVNTIGPIRQIVKSDAKEEKRYLVIAEGTPDARGTVVQCQTEDK